MARSGVVVLLGVAVVMGAVIPAAARETKKRAEGGVRKYVIMNLLLAAGDYESAHAVQHPGGCMESNPAFNRYPGRMRFYGEGLAIDAGPELVGWLLHRKHVSLWRLPFAVVAGWHAEGLVTNLRCNSEVR
ncbi:MAG TPA: hypothetical protein VKT29_09310 [Terriglobales bacterium]|nr:hypothetical protein [Terriglobales bacterium]